MRDAKDVAVHDLSFWGDTLPLLSGFYRIMPEYSQDLTRTIQLQLDLETGTELHRATLESFVRQVGEFDQAAEQSRRQADLSVWFEVKFGSSNRRRLLTPLAYDQPLADRLGRSLLDLVYNDTDLAELGIPASDPPRIHVPVPGCGSVAGGECDLLVGDRIVELKLTSAQVSVRDIRQVIVYSSLLRLATLPAPRTGIVANPRQGSIVQFELEELLMLTGGLTLESFSERLAQFLSSETQSN